MNCVFSILEPRRGDRKHTTSWIKIISHHIPWEILFITYLPPHTCFYWLYSLEGACGVGIHNVISKNYRMSVITLISRSVISAWLAQWLGMQGLRHRYSIDSHILAIFTYLLATTKNNRNIQTLTRTKNYQNILNLTWTLTSTHWIFFRQN
jgi:hypothetical protein